MRLTFSHLNKNYGKKPALIDFSAELREGIYGLLGPNGAGKSTLMNILTGNLRQNSGEILFEGQDIRTLGAEFRAKVGYMPQQPVFYAGFSVEQFLFYIASLRGLSKKAARERIDWALQELALLDVRHKSIRALSGGMKQRLLLAQAILAEPDILILDEPTAGLDPKQRIAVRNLIAKIALHKIVIVSTHIVSDVDYIAKELLLLSSGRLLRHDTPGKLVGELAGSVWEVTISEEQLPRLQEHGTICGISPAEESICVRLLSPKEPPFPCTALRPELEDVYLHFFGREEGL